jgi:Protein of unknown function (DUF3726)
MWVSLTEIETSAQRAARGAGYSWGLAEEAGQAARWLAMRGLPWLRPLSRGVLQHMAQLESFDSARLQGSIYGPSGPGRCLGPISVLMALSDEMIALPHAGAELSFRALAGPILILPVLVRLSKRFDRPLLVRWPGVAIECRGGEAFCEAASLNVLESGVADWVTVGRATARSSTNGPHSSVLHQGAEVEDHMWRELQSVARRTYVPESDTSRRRGAGTGLTDND